MPQFPEEDRWSRHAQAQVQSTSGEGTATRRTTGNTQEKPLPAMPRESGEFWLDESMDTRSIDDGDSVALEYLRRSPNPADALPPSPMSSANLSRPRAPTPSASVPASDDETWPANAPPRGSSGSAAVNLNSPTYPPQNTAQARYTTRHAPDMESNTLESASSRPFARPAKVLPDPSQFPDPYPYQGQPSRLSSHPPTLSSSSSASPRSSAYTTYSSRPPSNDYGHVRISEEDTSGLISDVVAQALENNGIASSTPGSHPSRAPIDKSRWSEHGFSVRSRSSSVSNTYPGSSTHDGFSSPPRLAHKPSYDASWATVDERDEVGMSDEDDDLLGDFEEEEEETELEDDQGDAVLAAEQGRGLIVRGDRRPVSQLHVQPGTTHLLVSSSTTPNSMPNFLANIVPQISNTLLALDISANFLSALPPVLAHCANLEELNVAYNPLRVLPVFVAHLTNLRVLIADSTGLATLPEALVDLDRLHTISVRKNKMHMLPSWLCLLPALGTLIVDGNPFQGPWKALVDPLLAKIPASPAYPPSTPMMPLPTSSAEFTYTESDESDDEFPPTRSSGLYDKLTAEEEEQTIMPDRLPPVNWEKTQMPPTPPIPQSPARGLTRTRTTPNRAFYAQNRAKSTVDEPVSAAMSSEDPNFAEREVRRMKSAGDLRRGRHFAPPPPEDAELSRPPLQHFAASSSNLLTSTSPPTTPDRPGMQKRFASVGAAATMGAFGRGSEHGTRRPLTHSMWDSSPDTEDHSSPGRAPGPSSPTPVPVTSPLTESPVDWGDNKHSLRGRRRKEGKEGKDGKEKAGRWGFLKKMSMGKMNPSKSDTPTSRPSPSMHRATPQIDIRFSTMGSFDAVVPFDTPPDSPKLGKKPSVDALRVVTSPPAPAPPALPSPPASANSLLTPTSTLAPKATKRRSFLPLDNPSLSISTPDASPFVGSMTVTNEEDSAEVEDRQPTPSPGPPPIDDDELMRMEEERQRDAYARALRSVMAYLKDMNDLGMSQQPATGQETESMFMTRPRRATAADGTTSPGSIASSEGQLRSTDSIRMNGLGQTMSMAPSEFSQGSGDERKYKDDRGKRAMIVREIVTTERTYVKGLQELMDIYIKPATQHANMLTGVGSNKDPAIVPAPERKIVFGGVEALCSFHKDIFLPALEVAAAPVLVNSSVLDEVDSDGQLSLNVARAVGNTFLKHAAFMRMYSSYINNFDHSVQRVKYWMTERNTGTNSPGSAAAPSSSVAQLAGMGMTISAISGANTDGSVMSGTHPLSTSQRKRIRQFLKRCRMNPRHSQLNLEGYLLLPVQRIPRYKMLLEQLMRSAPPAFEFMDDPIDRALQEISSLANNMNEGKRESESRRKLVQWQARIRGRFPSPLVQPHRRLIMDGPLLLTRVVRKTMVSFDAFNAQGDPSTVQVDCLAPELTPRPLIGILCNDLLVLCRDPSEGQDLNSYVDLWAVLRMQTLPQPASIVHGNSLRLVDNKAILYFDAPSPSDALNWYRAINLHIPASKS